MVGARWVVVLAVALLLSGVGCGKDGKGKGDFPKPVLARFAKADLKVGSFKAVKKPARYGAERCQEGTVNGLAVLICEYATDEALETSGRQRLRFVRMAVTGAQRIDGHVVLVVADRDKQDLRGKVIQRILQAFKKEKPF